AQTIAENTALRRKPFLGFMSLLAAAPFRAPSVSGVPRGLLAGLGLRRLRPAPLLRVPEVVVLPGPLDADTAARHSLERSFHAPGAEVDMPQRDRDPEHRRDAVNHVGRLHGLAR